MNNLVQLFNQYQYSSESMLFPVLLLAAFIAGIISSLSPCSLGTVPLIIGYVCGYNRDGGKRLFVRMLSFSFGLSFILSIIGIICALGGMAFTGFASPVVLLVFAGILTVLGLNILGIVDFNFPSIIKKLPSNNTGSLFIYPFIIGCLFSLVSSPCSSPILAAILALAAVSKNILFSLILLFLFALGQCIIIIFFAMFASSLKKISKYAKYSELIIKASGIILLICAVYIYYRVFSEIL